MVEASLLPSVSEAMKMSIEIPDCLYSGEPTLVVPNVDTPKHALYLSNIDNLEPLRLSIEFLYLYKTSVGVEALKASLSNVLAEYYPLAGRLRPASADSEKLELDCNGKGALFVEASVGMSAEEFLEVAQMPNSSWRKLMYRPEAKSFLDIPPLVVQVTHLRCGGMILCTAFCHCLIDGTGIAQFLQAWAHITAKPNTPLPVSPIHDRHMLKPRVPPQVTCAHPEFTASQEPSSMFLAQYVQCQDKVPVFVTFTQAQILQLKKLYNPLLECTSFEALTAHLWRSWAMAFDLPLSLRVKLIFSMNARSRLKPEIPKGFYGNMFMMACAEGSVEELMRSNESLGVKFIKEAKDRICDEFVRSFIDYLEKRKGNMDLYASLLVSDWSKLGLEKIDFGQGMPLHFGSLDIDLFCICLLMPVIGDLHAFTVFMSLPEKIAEKFKQYVNSF